MSFKSSWKIPRIDLEPLSITLQPGGVIAVLGQNGSGKSALLFWLNQNYKTKTVPITRIVAHRRIWLESAGPQTNSDPETSLRLLTTHERKPESRVSAPYEKNRAALLLSSLMGHESERNAKYVERVEAGESTDDVPVSILRTISDLMYESGLNLRFTINNTLEFEVKQDSSSYPITEMSDGEKASFLLAAEVLMAPADSIQLLDEPERHLHRSISSRLISTLIAARSDCGFIVSTHDLDLVQTLPPSNLEVLQVEKTLWNNGTSPSAWAIEVMANDLPITESVRRALLGGRKKLLFVEGESKSRDAPLLALLFPDWTVYPSGNSENVQKSVQGLLNTDTFHWTRAAGVIDRDCLTDEEAAALYKKNILALPVNEIENLYYLPWVVKAQAWEQAEHIGGSAEDLYKAALSAGLNEISKEGVLDNLAAENATKILRRRALAKLPAKQDLTQAPDHISLSLTSPFQTERAKLKDAVAQSDLDFVVTNYPIRDSGYMGAIAKALDYPTKSTYESALLTTLRKSPTLVAELQKFVGSSAA